MKWIGYLLAALAFAAAPATAWSADQYTLDKLHTQIKFSADDLGYSHSHGRFWAMRAISGATINNNVFDIG